MYCKKCGAKLRDNAKFCNKCGRSINRSTTPKITNNYKSRNLFACKTCGHLIAKNAKSCPHCGAKTPGQIFGECVSGVGCGLIAFPFLLILIVFYIVFLVF